MSDIDPYAPVEADQSIVAKNTESDVETPAVATVVPPQTEENVVPEGSIKKVLDWVGEDATRAQQALDAENTGEKRTTLINKLESLTN